MYDRDDSLCEVVPSEIGGLAVTGHELVEGVDAGHVVHNTCKNTVRSRAGLYLTTIIPKAK